MPRGNKDIAKYGFKKGDPRINRKGAPKKLPLQKKLMEALLGHTNEEDMTSSELAKVVKALIDETKNTRIGNQRVAAAKEILERVFGKTKAVEEKEEDAPIQWVETKVYIDGKKKK